MTGADAGASHGRPEYVIPALDLQGYFLRFFGGRARLLERLPHSSVRSNPSGENAKDPSVGIDDVEGWLHALSSRPGTSLREPWRRGIDALQKKFAVFGRVQRSYDENMRKTSEEEVPTESLCLLASLLLERHLAESDLNSLNSAIKLLDKAASRFEQGEAAPAFTAALGEALRLEGSILARLRHD